jgi:hypothetical protein
MHDLRNSGEMFRPTSFGVTQQLWVLDRTKNVNEYQTLTSSFELPFDNSMDMQMSKHGRTISMQFMGPNRPVTFNLKHRPKQ